MHPLTLDSSLDLWFQKSNRRVCELMITLQKNWPARRAIEALAQPPHFRYGIRGVPSTDAAKFSETILGSCI